MEKRVFLQLLLLQCITFYVSAMDNPALETNSAFCCLVKLPLEICNYIVSFLPWETEEEFVTRSKTKTDVDLASYYHYFEKGLFGCSESELFCVFSCDKSKCAVLKIFDHDYAQQNLTIVDLCAKKKIYNGDIKNYIYEGLALSCSGIMIATIHKDIKDPRVLIGPMYPYRVIVTNIGKQQYRTFSVPYLHEPFTVDFNKQGTDIVVHGTEYKHCHIRKKHIVFSLKSSLVKESDDIVGEPKKIDSQNQLHIYLRDKGVCKAIKGV